MLERLRESVGLTELAVGFALGLAVAPILAFPGAPQVTALVIVAIGAAMLAAAAHATGGWAPAHPRRRR